MAKRKQATVREAAGQPDWVEWSQIGCSSSWANDRLRFVRLIHKPICFFKYFINGKSAIVGSSSDNPIVVKYGIAPRRWYAINVINRMTRELKVLQGSELLFVHFRWFYEATGVDPGGTDACDFEIEYTNDRGKPAYGVRYDINARKPFSEEEKLLMQQNFFDLPFIFRPTPLEEIESRLGLQPL